MSVFCVYIFFVQVSNTCLIAQPPYHSELDDINDFLFNAFETLEPQVFDFRTPMMKVEMKC